jgi:hypothetical protein
MRALHAPVVMLGTRKLVLNMAAPALGTAAGACGNGQAGMGARTQTELVGAAHSTPARPTTFAHSSSRHSQQPWAAHTLYSLRERPPGRQQRPPGTQRGQPLRFLSGVSCGWERR